MGIVTVHTELAFVDLFIVEKNTEILDESLTNQLYVEFSFILLINCEYKLLFILAQAVGVWMNKFGWKEVENNLVLVANQEETVKTKNITEKIDFDSVAGIMAACR